MRAIDNRQKAISKKTWFQSRMPKTARAFGIDKTWFQSWMTRAFGLDAVQGSNETRASRIQKYGERVAQADDAVMRQEGWRSLGFAQSRPARPKGSGGDTIVEVIMATALIASATGLAYSMSNRNLSNGVSAGQRSQALSLAGAQIERLKNAYLTNSPTLDSYKIDKPFCILADGTEEDVNRPNSKCANFGSSPYSLSINYNKTTLVFKADVSWPSNSNTSGQDQLTLYYKLPVIFASTLPMSDCGNADATTSLDKTAWTDGVDPPSGLTILNDGYNNNISGPALGLDGYAHNHATERTFNLSQPLCVSQVVVNTFDSHANRRSDSPQNAEVVYVDLYKDLSLVATVGPTNDLADGVDFASMTTAFNITLTTQKINRFRVWHITPQVGGSQSALLSSIQFSGKR